MKCTLSSHEHAWKKIWKWLQLPPLVSLCTDINTHIKHVICFTLDHIKLHSHCQADHWLVLIFTGLQEENYNQRGWQKLQSTSQYLRRTFLSYPLLQPLLHNGQNQAKMGWEMENGILLSVKIKILLTVNFFLTYSKISQVNCKQVEKRRL